MMQLEQDGRVREGQSGIGPPEMEKPARVKKNEIKNDIAMKSQSQDEESKDTAFGGPSMDEMDNQ